MYGRKLIYFSLFFMCWAPEVIAEHAHVGHSDPIAPIILTTTGVLMLALSGRFLARQFEQPTVLGELLIGIIAGNLLYYFGFELITILRDGPAVFDIMSYVLQGETVTQAVNHALGPGYSADQLVGILKGPHGNAYLQAAQIVDGFSRYGVIFMLFLVGLESSVDEITRAGFAPLRVAIIGALLPLILGIFVVRMLMPHLGLNTDLFIAATLSATSVGITASVLHDLHQDQAKSTHIILGAAVIDDVLGLIILAIISGIIITGSVQFFAITKIIMLASIFIIGTFWLSPFFLRKLVQLLSHLDVIEAKLFISFIFVMTLAWLANAVGLATIIGAFAAGLILHDGYFLQWGDVDQHEYKIKDLIAPLEAILVPIFFILIGIQVRLESFVDLHVIYLAIGLTIAGIIGKLLCGLVAGKGVDKLMVGIGMLPRGEVGLVFATIGRTLGVINDELFASVVLMVIITTLMTPSLLKWRNQQITA